MKGYVLIREIREDIARLQKAVQKKRASFFFRKGKRKNETYDLSKIARLRVFHNEMVLSYSESNTCSVH